MSAIKTKNTTQKCFKAVCFLLCLFAFSCTESPQKIIEKAKKSVVTIKTPSGSGSGFIASADGLIITNNHVVENHATVEIHFPDGRTTVASPIKKGLSVLDVAYLKVDGSKFDYLPMNTNCNTGDEVYAIGAPLGLSESVSKGIISNCDRTIKGVKFIQTDAAVNAGNSGGPLINMKGEVVGLLTFKIAAEGVEGLNFALSPAVVRDYYENKLTNLEEAFKKEVAAKTPAPPKDLSKEAGIGPQLTPTPAPAPSRGELSLVIPANVKGKWVGVIIVVTDKDTGKTQEYNLKLNSVFKIPNSDLEISVGEFIPDFKMDVGTITSASNDTNNPAVIMKVLEGSREVFKGCLYSKFPAMHPFEHPRYDILLKKGIATHTSKSRNYGTLQASISAPEPQLND